MWLVGAVIAATIAFRIDVTRMSPCGEEYHRAALEQVRWVMNVPGYVCFNAMDCSDQVLEGYARKAKELREWAATLPDRCARAAFSGWADYVDSRIVTARKEAEVQRRRTDLRLPRPPMQ